MLESYIYCKYKPLKSKIKQQVFEFILKLKLLHQALMKNAIVV